MTTETRDDVRWGDKYTCMPVLQTSKQSIHENGLKNNNFNYQIVTGCSKPISDSESTQKINKNQKQNLNTKNVIFKTSRNAYHQVDRQMGGGGGGGWRGGRGGRGGGGRVAGVKKTSSLLGKPVDLAACLLGTDPTISSMARWAPPQSQLPSKASTNLSEHYNPLH